MIFTRLLHSVRRFEQFGDVLHRHRRSDLALPILSIFFNVGIVVGVVEKRRRRSRRFFQSAHSTFLPNRFFNGFEVKLFEVSDVLVTFFLLFFLYLFNDLIPESAVGAVLSVFIENFVVVVVFSLGSTEVPNFEALKFFKT